VADTHYETLGVPRTASILEIKEAFRTLAKSIHPDRYTDGMPEHAKATARMQKVTAAYDVLKDADRKQVYDFKLPGTNGPPSSAPPPSGGSTWRSHTYGGAGYDDLFRHAWGWRDRSQSGKTAGPNVDPNEDAEAFNRHWENVGRGAKPDPEETARRAEEVRKQTVARQRQQVEGVPGWMSHQLLNELWREEVQWGGDKYRDFEGVSRTLCRHHSPTQHRKAQVMQDILDAMKDAPAETSELVSPQLADAYALLKMRGMISVGHEDLVAQMTVARRKRQDKEKG